MQTLFVWLAILGFLPLIVRATIVGTISVNLAAVLMMLMVVAVSVGVKRFVFKAVVPIAAVAILAAQYANGDVQSFWAICFGFLTLSLALLGFYLMISGLFRGHR